MNLPLTLLYLLFMINANLFVPYYFGQGAGLTIALGGSEVVFPIITLNPGFTSIFTPDFFLMTMLTFFAPVLCFILELARKPRVLFRFLCQSTTLYAALSPLSSIGVLSYMVSRKALFLVTGDKQQASVGPRQVSRGFLQTIRSAYRDLLVKSHPDQGLVKSIELLTGIGFAIACFMMFQISFLGLCFAFILLPILHHAGWNRRWIRPLIYVPFVLIILGVFTAGLSLVGMQAVFFGYGFHF